MTKDYTPLTYHYFKRSKKKRRKLPALKTVKNKLWLLCKLLTRRRYKNVCYTCDKTGLVGANFQTGHLIPKSVLPTYLKYDLRVLRPQCGYCNLQLGGNGAIYEKRMRDREGHAYVDKIHADRKVFVKERDFLEPLLHKYEAMLNDRT